MKSVYTPDRWVVVKVGDACYKLLGGTSGGYLDGDSWQLNSGIVKLEEKGNYYIAHGNSGSKYRCYKGSYGLTSLTSSIFAQLLDKGCSLVEEGDITGVEYK